MKSKLILFIILNTLMFNGYFAQEYTNEGTDFWFSYPRIAPNSVYNDAIANNTFEVHITSRYATSGTISIDEHYFAPSPLFTTNFSTTPNQVTTVVLPSINVHNISWQLSMAGLNLHSVHVTSECPVTIFVQKP